MSEKQTEHCIKYLGEVLRYIGKRPIKHSNTSIGLRDSVREEQTESGKSSDGPPADDPISNSDGIRSD